MNITINSPGSICVEVNDDSRDVTVITYPHADHGIMIRRVPWPRHADGFVEQMVSWVAARADRP